MLFVGILFGVSAGLLLRLWLSRRRRSAGDLKEEEARARGGQFDSNAKPEEAYVTVLGRATLSREYQNFTREPNILLFEGSRRFKDGGFLYYIQFWKRGTEVSGAAGLKWHAFHSDTEVHRAHLDFFEFVRAALTEQGFSFRSRWTLDAPPKPASPLCTFGKHVPYQPPNLRGELPAHRRHFIVEGQPDWATITGISWLDGRGWRITERLRINPTALRVALESDGVKSEHGYDLIVELREETPQRIGVTLALQPRSRFHSRSDVAGQLAKLEQLIRSNAAKILNE